MSNKGLISGGELGGLAVALVLHGAVLALLVMQPAPKPLPVPERMEVSLADNVGLQSVAPSQQEAAPDMAPTLGEAPQGPDAERVAEPVRPEPVRPEVVKREVVKPPVAQPPVNRPPVAKPVVAKQEVAKVPAQLPAKVPAKVSGKETARADLKRDPVGEAIAKAQAAKQEAAKQAAAKQAAVAGAAGKGAKAPAGASRIGADFLKGLGSNTSGKAQTPPGKVAGPEVQNALKGAITRQLKPFWRVPQGVDTEQLVTVLRFSLNRDGSLAGPVMVVRQEGVNEANRAQAPLHRENAVRAVKLAAPFPLPPDYYEAWKTIEWNFNRNLAQ